jgi:hypothetical protein
MNLPIKFPSEEEVIIEEVTRFHMDSRLSSPSRHG